MSAAVIPEAIAQLQLQLDQIRSTQPRLILKGNVLTERRKALLDIIFA